MSGDAPFDIVYAPSPGLAPYILTYYLFRCELSEIEDIQRADVGHVMFFLNGHGTMAFATGRVDASLPVSLFGPATGAARFRVSGPFHCFGFGMSPAGWGALVGRPAHAHADSLTDARHVFGDDVVALHAALGGHLDAADVSVDAMAAACDAFFLARHTPLPARHRHVVDVVTDWLSSSFNPDLDALYAQLPFSRRQAERIIKHYFGAPPRFLLRKFRANRAAALLLDAPGDDVAPEHLADCFYDQSHMINEIKHFTGRTPQRLSDSANPILKMWLARDNFRELDRPDALAV